MACSCTPPGPPRTRAEHPAPPLASPSDTWLGPTCSSPWSPADDVSAFLDVGAYSLERMSACIGRDQAAASMVTGAGLRRIAQRRTAEDFVAGEHFVLEK